MADLDPTRGREQAGRRPVLVISVDLYNQGPADLILACPITSKRRGVLYHVSIDPPEGGLSLPSDILCDAVRSLAKERLLRRLGGIAPHTMSLVEERLRILQGL
jgi:mRNA interferase MazF